jgi:hypothetical protein
MDSPVFVDEKLTPGRCGYKLAAGIEMLHNIHSLPDSSQNGRSFPILYSLFHLAIWYVVESVSINDATNMFIAATALRRAVIRQQDCDSQCAAFNSQVRIFDCPLWVSPASDPPTCCSQIPVTKPSYRTRPLAMTA